MTHETDFPHVDGADPTELDGIDIEQEYEVEELHPHEIPEDEPERRGAGPLDYMGAVKPATRQKTAEVLTYATEMGARITHIWGYDPNERNVEHHSGLAADFMLYNKIVSGGIDTTTGNRIADYLWKHRNRLGVRHIIWRQRIISTVISPGVWRGMADRGNQTDNHFDHVHVLYLNSPYVAEPYAPAPTPPPPPKPKPVPTDPARVRLFQSVLEVAADGKWGPGTDARAMRMRAAAREHFGWPTKINTSWNVRDVQVVVDTAVDGVVGRNTINAIQRWVRQAQAALGVPADGWWGPATETAFIKLRSANLNKF